MSYNNDLQKKCGFCGETIPARAGRCHYCGSLLEVTFDNAYGGNQSFPDQQYQPNQPAYPGMDQSNAQFGSESNAQSGNQSGSSDFGSEPGSEPGGTEGSAVNDESLNTARNPESSGGQGQPQIQPQTEPQPQTQAPAQYQPQQGGQGQWQNTERPIQDYQRPYYQNRPQQGQRYEKPALSNGLKVFLTILFAVLPGIGQLAGIITAIVFMSSEGDKDRRSFGVALLVACIIMFVLSCIGCFILSIASASLPFNSFSNR